MHENIPPYYEFTYKCANFIKESFLLSTVLYIINITILFE
jgi:hypothetical protein